MRKLQIFEIGAKRPLGHKFGPRGLNCLKNDCWGPGDSILWGFVRKVQIFEFGAKRSLGPKFGPRGPNHLKKYS